MGLTADQVDGFNRSRVYPDGTVVRVSLRRTDSDAYPSRRKYTFHYDALDPESPGTLSDGTILRYLENLDFRRLVETATPFRDDNSHEDTKGHERHVAPESEPDQIEFPGILELWGRFWSEISRSTFALSREE